MNMNDIDKVIDTITAAQGIKITGTDHNSISFIKVAPDTKLLKKAKRDPDIKKILKIMEKNGLNIRQYLKRH